jgi:hypothetical protein
MSGLAAWKWAGNVVFASAACLASPFHARGDEPRIEVHCDHPVPTADHWAAVVVNGERIEASVVDAKCRRIVEDDSTAQLSDEERRERLLLAYGNQWQDLIERKLILQHIARTGWNPEQVARWRAMAQEIFTRDLKDRHVAGPADQLPRDIVRMRREYQDDIVAWAFLAGRVLDDGKGAIRSFLTELRHEATIEVIGQTPVVEWSMEEQGIGVTLGFDHSE